MLIKFYSVLYDIKYIHMFEEINIGSKLRKEKTAINGGIFSSVMLFQEDILKPYCAHEMTKLRY
jgi:hypothetical protein